MLLYFPHNINSENNAISLNFENHLCSERNYLYVTPLVMGVGLGGGRFISDVTKKDYETFS